jgi:hypothetical protein
MPAARCVAGCGGAIAADTTGNPVLCTAVPMPQPPRLIIAAAAGADIKHLFKRSSLSEWGAFECDDHIQAQCALCDRARIYALVHCDAQAKRVPLVQNS